MLTPSQLPTILLSIYTFILFYFLLYMSLILRIYYRTRYETGSSCQLAQMCLNLLLLPLLPKMFQATTHLKPLVAKSGVCTPFPLKRKAGNELIFSLPAVLQEHETPGAQFAKFAEIPEPLPHAPVGGPAQPAPTSVSTLPSSNSSQPSPFQSTYLPSYPASHPSSQPATLQIPAQLSVSIPSPSDTPIPSPLTGNFLESMASMEYLTNSLLTSMAITTSTSTGQVPSMAERPTGRHSLSPSPSLLTPHPDDAIQSKYEEKLKAAEERLIHLKSMSISPLAFAVFILISLAGDLARTKTEKDDFRDKLRSLKEKEKTLKSRYPPAVKPFFVFSFFVYLFLYFL